MRGFADSNLRAAAANRQARRFAAMLRAMSDTVYSAVPQAGRSGRVSRFGALGMSMGPRSPGAPGEGLGLS